MREVEKNNLRRLRKERVIISFLFFTILISMVSANRLTLEINCYEPVNDLYTRSSDIIFKYNVSGINGIENCYLVVNNQTLLSRIAVSKDIEETFSLSFLSNGTFVYSINCLDDFGNLGSSGDRIINIEPNETRFKLPIILGSQKPNSVIAIENNKTLAIKEEEFRDLSFRKQVNKVTSSMNYWLFKRDVAIYIATFSFFVVAVVLYCVIVSPKKNKRIKRGNWN